MFNICIYLKYESTISKIAKNFQRVFCYQNTMWTWFMNTWNRTTVNMTQHCHDGKKLWSKIYQPTYWERLPTNQINNLTSFVTLTYHEYHWGGQGHGKNTRSGYLGISVASMKNSHCFDNVNILFLRTKMFLTTEFQEQIWNNLCDLDLHQFT